MAQWIRNWTGGGPTGTDANVTGGMDATHLDNDTLPADFNPAAVNSVRFQLTLYVSSGTIVDDSYTGNTINTEVYNPTPSPTVAASVPLSWTPSAINSGASSMSFDVTDSSVVQTWSNSDWTGMRWIVQGGGSWATFTAGMKADGTTVSVQSGTITIDYTPVSSDRQARVSFAELEVPTAPRQARVSFAELEIPDGARQARVSFAEFEIPNADRKAQVSFTEFEVPNAPTADRLAQVSFAELEIPDGAREAWVSFAELEVPDAPRRVQVSFAEMETPDGPRRAQVSFAEFEVPTAPRRTQVSFAELEVPDAPRRAQVAFAEVEVPTAPRRAQVSFAELETPQFARKAQVSFAEFQVPSPTGVYTRTRGLSKFIWKS